MGRKRKTVDLDKAATSIPLSVPEAEARADAEIIASESNGAATYIIAVPYLPTLELTASDEADAWRQYCEKTGLKATSHTPIIRVIHGK